jgi:hypothetical protein
LGTSRAIRTRKRGLLDEATVCFIADFGVARENGGATGESLSDLQLRFTMRLAVEIKLMQYLLS